MLAIKNSSLFELGWVSPAFTPFAPMFALGHLPRQGGGLILRLPLDGGAVSRRLTEGVGNISVQIGRNSPLCGTFAYIFWKLRPWCGYWGKTGRSRTGGDGSESSGAGAAPWQLFVPFGRPNVTRPAGRNSASLACQRLAIPPLSLQNNPHKFPPTFV